MKTFASVLEKTVLLHPTYRSRYVLGVSEPFMACQNEKKYRGDEIPYLHTGLLICLILFLNSQVFAQTSSTGALLGVVIDASGASLLIAPSR